MGAFFLMTAASEPLSGKATVAVWSLASVVLLALMCWIYLLPPDPERYPAFWYTLLLATPYVFIAVRCLRSEPAPSVFQFANGVGRAAIIGILLVTILPAVGLFLLLIMMPTPLAYSGLVGGDIAGHLQGGGLSLLLVLFVVQFPLARSALRAAPTGTPDQAPEWRMYGFATLLLPFLIYAHINVIRSNREGRAVEKSRAENTERERARQEALDKASDLALQVARTGLHVCVYSKCADSLIGDLKRRRFAVNYMPLRNGRYFLVVGASEYDGPKFVTDETGIVGRLKGAEQFRIVTPGFPYDLVDSVYLDLALIRNCIRDETISEWDEYPLHLPSNVGCYMHGDTTVVHFRHGADYRVIYASPRSKEMKLVKTFSLDMRPVDYGKPYVRSFLMTQDTTYVATANRSARKSDLGLDPCETDRYYCDTHH